MGAPLLSLLPIAPFHSWDPRLSLMNEPHLRVGFPGSPARATRSDLPPAPLSLRLGPGDMLTQSPDHTAGAQDSKSLPQGPRQAPSGCQQPRLGQCSWELVGVATGSSELRLASPRQKRWPKQWARSLLSQAQNSEESESSKFDFGLNSYNEGVYLV